MSNKKICNFEERNDNKALTPIMRYSIIYLQNVYHLCVPFGAFLHAKNKRDVPFLYNLLHFKPHNKQKRQPFRTALG